MATHTSPHARKSGRPAPLAPDVLAEFLKQATAKHSAGQFEDAAALYEHVELHNPEALAATYFRALMDIETGFLERALTRLRRLTARDPDSHEGQQALGYVFQELGLWPQAASAYRRALALKPQSTASAFSLAGALETLGEMDSAVAQLRALAALPRVRLRALIGIALLRPAALNAEEQAEMAAAAASEAQPMGGRVGAYFALGEMLERQGRDDEAFAAFARGCALKRANLEANADEPAVPSVTPPESRIRALRPEVAAQRHAQSVAEAKRIFTPEFLAAHKSDGHDSAAPIFILGMPRSGSTLLEQILSSHAKVQGLGESGALFDTIRGRFPYGNEPPRDNYFRALAETYLEKQRAAGWAKTPRFVDKMLANYVNIGMIHLMFPNAVILHSARDALDTCLAGYRKLFRTGNETTYDLSEIGAHYVRYREMMAHWARVLPGRVIDVEHEALVADPQGRIRWLITQACGLKWDEACLDFHRTRRAVRTASIAQVRQPIFKTSVARWKKYERHLGPLFEALGAYAAGARGG